MDTRWCSHYDLCHSIYSQFSDIEQILEEKGELYRIMNIEESTLKLMVEFLEPFVIASKQLEAENLPTVHFIIPLLFVTKTL